MSIKSLARSLPRVVQIGHLPFKVEFADGWVKHEDSNKWGLCDHSKATLLLAGPTIYPNKEMMVSILVHEILHALWGQANLPSKGVKEEVAVAGLENVLTTFIRNNPKVMDWIRKALK